MPPGTGVRTPEGDAAFEAIATIRGPDGFGVAPNGMEVDLKGLVAGASTVIKDALESHWQYIAAVLLGSDGTMTRGTGVYSAPIFAGVRRDLVDRDLRAQVRGANVGHIAPWLAFNYAAAIEEAPGWIAPVLDIPLPDPDADARIKSYSDRVKSFHEIIEKESRWFVITQERVEQLAKSLEIEPPSLNLRAIYKVSAQSQEKITRVDEARKASGMDPLGDDRGELLVSELDAPAETTKVVEAEKDGEDGVAPPPDETNGQAQDGPAEFASNATNGGGGTTAGEANGAAAASPG
jgi:phosphopantetheine adenylyltransferase